MPAQLCAISKATAHVAGAQASLVWFKHSPCLTIIRLRTDRSGETMQPRTDFLRRSPVLRPYPRKQLSPGFMSRRTRPGTRTPCFMGKPCLSWPPMILKMKPLNSCEPSFCQPVFCKRHVAADVLNNRVYCVYLAQRLATDFLGQPLVVKSTSERTTCIEHQYASQFNQCRSSDCGVSTNIAYSLASSSISIFFWQPVAG